MNADAPMLITGCFKTVGECPDFAGHRPKFGCRGVPGCGISSLRQFTDSLKVLSNELAMRTIVRAIAFDDSFIRPVCRMLKWTLIAGGGARFRAALRSARLGSKAK